MGATSQSSIGKTIKGYIKAMDKEKKFPLPHLLVHPDEPTALPALHFQHAFGAQQPVPFVIEGLQCAVASCAHRKSHGGVKEQCSAVAPR
eukprot:332038-Pyramimonas_sp.AAC.1